MSCAEKGKDRPIRTAGGWSALSRRRTAALALGLAAAMCSTPPPSISAAEGPARAVGTPSPGMRLTAALEPSTLQPGGSVWLRVELRNDGRDAVPVAVAGRCNPAFQPILFGAGGGVAWAPGLPLCQEYNGASRPISLPAGSALRASQCFTLGDGGRSGIPCARLELAAGSYRLGGSFHGLALPRLQLILAP